jgi:hypothetical protein
MKKILFLSVALTLLVTGCSMGNKVKLLNKDEAKAKAIDFIDNNLVQAGSKVTVKDIIEEDGLYKLTVVLSSGQEVTSYLSKDGSRFYPQSISIADVEKQKLAQDQTANAKTDTATAANNNPATPTSAVKADKPTVELFVMSYCPYGTQIEKGILPAIAALGNKVNFKLEFCDYSMHGDKELKENLVQTCIEKNEPTKLATYLSCFLQASDSAGCLTKAGINQSSLNSCVSATDKQYKVTAGAADKSTWANGTYPSFNVFKAENDKYSVGGSPTLVLNGKQIESGRDPKSLLATICSGFKTQPSECKKVLSSDSPAPGFGTAAAASGAASSGGGCATN